LIRNTVLLNVYGLLFGFPIPILFALLLNELRDGIFKRFVQTVSYLPHFLSTMVVIGLMFFLLSPNNGVVNQILGHFGQEPIFFMGEASWFRTLYVGSGIWQGFGWGAIIYIAGMSSIDPQLYEAAQMDGASRLKRAIHITLPGILPTIQIMLILSIAGMMTSGVEKVLAMYDASMYDVSDVISTFVYRRGIQSSDFSYAAAVDLFNAVVNFILLVLANKISKRINGNGIF
jgi:putative aldouronate transport system permease protein